jgi:threonine efflux protein
VVAAVGAVSATVFLGYALLFSHPAAQRTYARGARWIHGLSAVAFGAFALRLALGRPG